MYFTKQCNPDDYPDVQETLKNVLHHLSLEYAVLVDFDKLFKRLIGGLRLFQKLPLKARAMLDDIREIRKLNWILLNSDSVKFFTELIGLKTNEFQLDTFTSYSIFKFSNDETSGLIQRLTQLAKQRCY